MISGRVIEPKIVIIDAGCKWTAPVYISKSDGLTDGTARQILSHNETWERNCAVNK